MPIAHAPLMTSFLDSFLDLNLTWSLQLLSFKKKHFKNIDRSCSGTACVTWRSFVRALQNLP